MSYHLIRSKKKKGVVLSKASSSFMSMTSNMEILFSNKAALLTSVTCLQKCASSVDLGQGPRAPSPWSIPARISAGWTILFRSNSGTLSALEGKFGQTPKKAECQSGDPEAPSWRQQIWLQWSLLSLTLPLPCLHQVSELSGLLPAPVNEALLLYEMKDWMAKFFQENSAF